METIDLSEHLWQFVNNLLESLRYAENLHKIQEESIDKLQEYDTKKKRLSEFLESINKLSKRLEDDLNSQTVSTAIEKIQSFCKMAIEEVNAKLEDELKREVASINERLSVEKVKSQRLLEKYLQSVNFPSVERSFKLSYMNGVYVCQVKYNSPMGIEYTFNLLCHESEPFSDVLRVSYFLDEIRIPVAVSSNWMRRKGTAKFEKLSNYVVKDAEFSDKHSYVVLFEEEANSLVIISSPFPEEKNLIGINYVEGDNRLDITSSQELFPFIERDEIISLLSKLRKEVTSLEDKKGTLKEVRVEGQDILENMNIRKLADKVLEHYGQQFRKLVVESKEREILAKSGKLTYSAIQQRLKLYHFDPELLSSFLA